MWTIDYCLFFREYPIIVNGFFLDTVHSTNSQLYFLINPDSQMSAAFLPSIIANVFPEILSFHHFSLEMDPQVIFWLQTPSLFQNSCWSFSCELLCCVQKISVLQTGFALRLPFGKYFWLWNLFCKTFSALKFHIATRFGLIIIFLALS